MTAPSISSMAPVRLVSTVLAADQLRLSPNVVRQPFRHSGNEFFSVMTVPGAAPRARFRTPFYPAFALLGFKGLAVTVADLYLSTFSGAVRQATGRKLALAASCNAFAFIRSVDFRDRGIAMAEIEIIYLSSDGMTFPITPSDTQALPTLGSEPTLHTLGPATAQTTTAAGLIEATIDLDPTINVGIDGTPGDGLLYPTVCQHIAGNPSIVCGHGDALSVENIMALIGVGMTSNFVLYARQYDTATQLALATGLSFTIAAGRITPEDINSGTLSVAKAGYRVDPLSATGTHPIVVATGATVPTP